MKYEFTGTVKDYNKPKSKYLKIIILFIVFTYAILGLLALVYNPAFLPFFIIIAFIGLLRLYSLSYYKTPINIPNKIDESNPYFRGVISKIKMDEKCIRITKLGTIPWEKVIYAKKRAYYNGLAGIARSVEIVFEHETGTKKAYLIEAPVSEEPKSRYVSTMVDYKTYEEVARFLGSKTRLLGILG